MTDLDLDQEGQALRSGLLKSLPEIPARFFYDDRGMELFDQITKLPEYYPTQTETAILEQSSLEILKVCRPESVLELGAGEAIKVRKLIEAGLELGCLRRVVLSDVNQEAVESSCRELAADYPTLAFESYVGDHTQDLSFVGTAGPELVAFLGGSFGNFQRRDGVAFLARLRSQMRSGDSLLLGADLVKDVKRLEAAYNDSQGVTAAFNLNALTHFNFEMGSDFVPDNFEHVAFFDTDNSWIELRLRAKNDNRVSVPALNLELSFKAGDAIRTEVSCKYTRESLAELARIAGFSGGGCFTDSEELFALSLMLLES